MASASEPFPQGTAGQGIVICGGGYTYFTNAWVCIRMLRHLGCKLPIQLWHLGPVEVNDRMKRLVAGYGVECVDGLPIIQQNTRFKNGRVKVGWVLKSVAVARCHFSDVIYLDADNVPVRDPSFLFNTPQYKATGALFWPDIQWFADPSVWRVFRMRAKIEREFESGQLVVNRRLNWESVVLAENINFRADIFYRFMWGDKDTFRFAWHKARKSFAMPGFPAQCLKAAGAAGEILCQHDFQGTRLFQHRIFHKWNLHGYNPWIAGFLFENECRAFLDELRSRWDGRCGNPRARSPRIPEYLACEQSLIKTVWLLQAPRPIKKRSAKQRKRFSFNKAPPTYTEVRFAKNGTLSANTDRMVGCFWDLKQSSKWQLVLSDEAGEKVKLTRNGVWWTGHWLVNGSPTKMSAVEDIYPHLRIRTRSETRATQREIKNSFGHEVHLMHTAAGIGDHICAVYACAGLARTGVRVVLHTPHAPWLSRVTEPGLTISNQPAEHYDRDLEYDYQNQLRYGISRLQWYAGALHPSLKPVEPQVDRRQLVKRVPFDRYVLLSPFASFREREWVNTNWTRLAHLLREAGYDVVAIGNKSEKNRLDEVFNETQAYWVVNHPAEWVIDAMLGADGYIGVDNGMTHLASLMDIRPIAIHSQLRPEFLWPKGRVVSITPDARCVFCRWQDEGGWVSSCKTACSALALVKPEDVLDAVLKQSSRPYQKAFLNAEPRKTAILVNGKQATVARPRDFINESRIRTAA